MKSTTKKSGTRVEINFEIPAEEFNNYFEKAVSNLSKDLKMDGFRPGKVPVEIIEKELGQGKILEEAANLAAREKYVEVIIKEKIEAIGRPEIEVLKLAKNNPFEFKASVSVLPEIKLPDYRSIASKIKRKEAGVEKTEIAEALNWLQKSRAKFTSKPGPAAKGNWIEIGLKIKNPDSTKEEAPIKDAFLLGEGKLVPGLEEKLEGMVGGEEKEVTLTFPQNHYRKDLAGKQISMQVEMKSVQNRELPQIDDQFAKSLGNFPDLRSLEKNIEDGLLSEKKAAESQRLRNEILEKTSESSGLEIPDILIQSEKEKMLDNMKQMYSSPDSPMSFEGYLKDNGKSEKEMLESLAPEAKKRVKSFLVLREISKKENIEVSEEEIENEIKKMLKNYPDIRKPEKEIDLQKLKEYAEGAIRNEKTFAILENLVK